MFKCSSLFPHLFYPKRVITIYPENSNNLKLNAVFDKLIGRDRESNCLPINLQKNSMFKNISSVFPRGALVYEYSFDRNMAVAELYRMCKNEGAFIICNEQKIDAKAHFVCKPLKFENISLLFDMHDWPYQNPFRIINPNFDTTFQGSVVGTIAQIHLKRKVNIDEIIEILKNFNLPINKKIEHSLATLIESQKLESIPENSIIDFTLSQSRKSVLNIIKKCKRDTGTKIQLNKAFACLSEFEMRHQMFRQIDDECNQKFDLAKQTGVEYALFSRLFYRYRSHIDMMTEIAYDSLEKTRDAEFLWKTAEKKIIEQEYS